MANRGEMIEKNPLSSGRSYSPDEPSTRDSPIFISRRDPENSPEETQPAPNFGSRISSQTAVQIFLSSREPRLLPRSLFRVRRPATRSARQERVTYRIRVCATGSTQESGAEEGETKGGKYLEYRVMMWRRPGAARVSVGEAEGATTAATLPAEFYEGIYMSAIFYGPLNARSRSVPHCRGSRL